MLFFEGNERLVAEQKLRNAWKNVVGLKNRRPDRESGANLAYLEFMNSMGADWTLAGVMISMGSDLNIDHADRTSDFFLENSRAVINSLESDDKGVELTDETRNFFLSSLAQNFPKAMEDSKA